MPLNNENEEIFKLLKVSRDSEHEIDSVVAALHGLLSLSTDRQVQGLATKLQSEMSEHRKKRYGFKKYFSGEGPIATRIKDHIAIDHWIMGGTRSEVDQELRVVLELFDYEPITDDESIKDFVAFLQTTIPMIYSRTPTVQPIQDAPAEFNVSDAQTGFYVNEARRDIPQNVLVLRAEIPECNTHCVFLAIYGMEMQMYCYHPQEQTYVFTDGTAILPGMHQALVRELEVAFDKLKRAEAIEKDWDSECAQILTKVNSVFDSEDRLPQSVNAYCALNPEFSTIEFNAAGHHYIYRCTRGEYPSRSMSITRNLGMLVVTVKFEELTPAARYRFVSVANYELDRLLAYIAAQTGPITHDIKFKDVSYSHVNPNPESLQ